jgi:N-acetylmuramoyl-L-alanine amidase
MINHVFARTIWGEARGEGELGMEAVACVIVNRAVLGGWWGESIEEVCLKPWQFSCWNKNDPNRPELIAVGDDDPQFKICLAIAEKAYAGTLKDVTHGADSYHDIRMNPPKWADNLKPVCVIKHHVFYKTRE